MTTLDSDAVAGNRHFRHFHSVRRPHLDAPHRSGLYPRVATPAAACEVTSDRMTLQSIQCGRIGSNSQESGAGD